MSRRWRREGSVGRRERLAAQQSRQGAERAHGVADRHPLERRDALDRAEAEAADRPQRRNVVGEQPDQRSEEHTSELQSLMRISYAVFCLKKKKTNSKHDTYDT